MRGIVFAGIAALLGTADVRAAAYDVIDLGDPTGAGFVYGAAINNAGQITGFLGVGGPGSSNSNPRGFIWSGGTSSILPTLNDVQSNSGAAGGRAITASGIVVGDSRDGTGSYNAAIWENGSVRALGRIPGSVSSSAAAINNAGRIIGVIELGGLNHAALWVNELPTLIGEPDGYSFGGANDINSSGAIVGSAAKFLAPGLQQRTAFLYDNSVFTDLLAPRQGIRQASARSINDQGQIVGAYSYDSTAPFKAFLWEQGALLDLSDLPGYVKSGSVPAAINEAGKIVGRSDGAAVIWMSEEEIFDLNDQVSDIWSDWNLIDATDVNNAGYILARATKDGENRTLLLSPTGEALVAPSVRLAPELPEPVLIWLFAPAVALLIAHRTLAKRSNETWDAASAIS